jgi:hypothetical protein
MKIDKQSLNNNISSGGNKNKLNLCGLAYQNLSKIQCHPARGLFILAKESFLNDILKLLKN